MPKKMLTDRFVQFASSPDAPQTDFFDTGCPGLSLRVGRAQDGAQPRRTWSLTFTSPDTGKRARVKLGTYPELPLAEARVRAITHRAAIAGGVDVAKEKKKARKASTFNDLATTYQSSHADGLRSGPDIRRRLNTNVLPALGSVAVAKLRRSDFATVVDAVKKRGAKIEAARVFQDLRGMLRWALDQGLIDVDPMAGMKRPADSKPRERVLGDDEIKKLWQGLDNAEMSASSATALRLALVTGQRLGEVTGAELAEFDLEAKLWTIPGDRVKNGDTHTVPLSALALELVRTAKALAQKRGAPSRYLFPRPHLDEDGPIDSHSVSTAVRRSQAIIGLPKWTAHDLRRSAVTGMLELDIDLLVVGHVVNHKTTTRATVTTQRYDRKNYGLAKRAALDLWGAHIAGLVGAGALTPAAQEVADA